MTPSTVYKSRITGLTLVEILIALVISTIVVGTIITLYVKGLESSSYQNAAARVQDNGRFAIDQLARTMRMARYDDPDTAAAPVTGLLGTDSEDGSLSMNGFTLKAGTDVIQIEYEGAPGVRDCQGVAVAADAIVINTYAVADTNELICETNNADPLVIVEGIEDMELRYGVDADGDGVPNRYVAAADVADWSLVVAGRMAILVNSVENVFANSIRGCESCDAFNPPANQQLRAEFHGSVRFRNL